MSTLERERNLINSTHIIGIGIRRWDGRIQETGNSVSLEFFHESTGKGYKTTLVKMLDGVVTHVLV